MSVLKLNAFKFERTLPERVQVDRIGSSTLEMKQQVGGADEFSAPTASMCDRWAADVPAQRVLVHASLAAAAISWLAGRGAVVDRALETSG